MFFEFALLGVVVGWLRGGRIKHLAAKIPVLPALVFLALIIQGSLVFLSGTFDLLSVYSSYIHAFSYVLLLSFALWNRKLPGMPVVALGVFLNFLVIALNGGTMPVSTAGMPPEVLERLAESVLHSAAAPGTRLAFLGDVVPAIGRGKISPGDILMGAGVFFYLQQAMQRKRERGTRSFRHR